MVPKWFFFLHTCLKTLCGEVKFTCQNTVVWNARILFSIIGVIWQPGRNSFGSFWNLSRQDPVSSPVWSSTKEYYTASFTCCIVVPLSTQKHLSFPSPSNPKLRYSINEQYVPDISLFWPKSRISLFEFPVFRKKNSVPQSRQKNSVPPPQWDTVAESWMWPHIEKHRFIS